MKLIMIFQLFLVKLKLFLSFVERVVYGILQCYLSNGTKTLISGPKIKKKPWGLWALSLWTIYSAWLRRREECGIKMKYNFTKAVGVLILCLI